MRFSEMREQEPIRYQNLEQIAREKGYLKGEKTLADLSKNPEQAWLEEWLAMSLEGQAKGFTPGQMKNAHDIAAYANRNKKVRTGTTGGARAFTSTQQPVQHVVQNKYGLAPEQLQATENIAAHANRLQHGAEDGEATTIHSAQPNELDVVAHSISEYANNHQQRGRSRVPMAGFSTRP